MNESFEFEIPNIIYFQGKYNYLDYPPDQEYVHITTMEPTPERTSVLINFLERTLLHKKEAWHVIVNTNYMVEPDPNAPDFQFPAFNITVREYLDDNFFYSFRLVTMDQDKNMLFLNETLDELEYVRFEHYCTLLNNKTWVLHISSRS